MATLVSPGVSVSVIDESFYGSAGAGTVPLIVVATGANKTHVSGTGIASGTTATNVKKPQLITSQRELIQSFGSPYFKSVSGTVQQGYETNEYGLLAAYSYLGSANRAYVVRADVDTSQLEPSTTEPKGSPANGALWLDTTNTSIGLFQYNATTAVWDKKTVTAFTAAQMTSGAPTTGQAHGGTIGDYRIAYTNADGDALMSSLGAAQIYKMTGATTWTAVNYANRATWGVNTSSALSITNVQPTGPAGGDVWIKTGSANQGTSIVVKSYNSTTDTFTTKTCPIQGGANTAAADASLAVPGTYDTNSAADVIITSLDTNKLFDSVGGASSTSFTILDGGSGYTSAPTVTITGAGTVPTVNPTAVISGGKVVAILVNADDAANAGASLNLNDIQVTLTGGINPPADSVYAFAYDQSTAQDAKFELQKFPGASATSATVVGADISTANATAGQLEASTTAITGATTNGTYWYNDALTADGSSFDIYKKGNTVWQPVTVATGSGGLGLKVSVGTSAPTTGSGGGNALATGDLWIDTTSLESFPVIKEYNATTTKWVARDSTDQSTPNGVVFADLTETAGDVSFQGSGSHKGATRIANAPNPALYPDGILIVNMIRSSYHVLKYDSSISTTYKWRSAAGNKADGSAYFGRKAQRAVIVKQMQASLSSNDDIRADSATYNLIAAPGYPELADEMLTLNVDRKETAFVIIDPPFRLAPSGVTAWMAGTNGTENGEDAMITSGSQCAVYYPSGLATNTDGSSVVVPASHMALRTISFNDQVAYPWFAPAGLTRGLVSNATNVGYLDGEGEFSAVALNEGQRDTLYTAKVNPITNFPGQGLFVYGQKTLSPTSSALDRVNVARLIAYLRDRLDPLARPFAFEPNDEATRANAAESVSRFLGDIMAKRGVYDFAVVCDTTNNTSARIDKNELYIDIAIEPTKAAEFIYIPIRIVNTGTL